MILQRDMPVPVWGFAATGEKIAVSIAGQQAETVAADGKWKVTLISSDTQEGALAVYDQLRAGGYAAEIHPAKAGDKRLYSVRIGNLPSKQEAESLAGQLKGKMGVVDPRVST